MLPFAQPFIVDAAARWSSLGVPRWVTSGLLTIGWGLAFLAAVAGDTARCSPDQPAICGPDQGFAWWFVVCAATPVLLVWMPMAGCLAGAAFGAADLAYDDVTSGNVGFGLHGSVCVVVAVLLWRAAVAQERAAAEAGGGFAAALPSDPRPPEGGTSWARLSAAGVLVLLGAGLLGWYGHEVQAENAHLSRAERVAGRVLSISDDGYSITLEADAGGGARRVVKDVLDTGTYPVGSTTPLLLDPQDASWSRLVAEPEDATGWETAGLGALLLALLLGLVELQAWRARRRLLSGQHPAVRVWVVPDETGAALVFADDGGGRPTAAEGPLARLPVFSGKSVDEESAEEAADWNRDPEEQAESFDDPFDDEWDAATAASFGRAWRGETDPHDEQEEFHLDPVAPEQAVMLGSLRDRGWVALVTHDEVLLPLRPLRVGLRAGRRAGSPHPLLARLPMGPWCETETEKNSAADPIHDDVLPGVPVSPSVRSLPDLPVLAPTTRRHRATGLAAIGAALAGAPAVLVLSDLDWYGQAMVIFTGGSVLLGGVARALQNVRLTHSFLEVRGAWRVEQVPWERLHGVRRDGAVLAIAWEPDAIIEVGPFQAVDGGAGQEERAEELGAIMLRLRERALVVGAQGRPTAGRRGPALGFLAAYAALVAVALWTVLSQ